MRRIPRSALLAARDVAALTAATLVVGSILGLWALDVARAAWAASVPPFEVEVTPGAALSLGVVWTRALIPWLLVAWCASRARTAWLPALLTLAVVAVSTLLPAVPGTVGDYASGWWPGPVDPFLPPRGGTFLTQNPAGWGYAVATAAALVVSSFLGGRARRVHDGSAARRLVTLPRRGRVLATAIVGVPACVATVATALAGMVAERAADEAWDTSAWFGAVDALLPLLLALAGAALVSGSGPLGLLAAAVASATVVVGPVSSWLAGGSDTRLAQAAAGLLACAVVAAWRPCATWAAEVLDEGRPPLAPSATQGEGRAA